MIRRTLALIGVAILLTAADDPKDYLKDPAEEARAKALFHEIRCVVCQNETIAGSDADIAHDVRMLVREQIAAGASDGEVKQYLLARYGDFILMRPRFTARNAVLWTLPFAIVLVGGALIVLRRRSGAAPAPDAPQDPLSPDELNALKQLQKNRDQNPGE